MYGGDEYDWQDTNHELGRMEKIYWDLVNEIIDNDKVIYWLSFFFQFVMCMDIFDNIIPQIKSWRK